LKRWTNVTAYIEFYVVSGEKYKNIVNENILDLYNFVYWFYLKGSTALSHAEIK